MRQVKRTLRAPGARRAVSAALVTLVAYGPLGCAHRPLITSLPPVVMEKPPGTVALMISNAAPSARIQQPGFVNRTVGTGTTRMARRGDDVEIGRSVMTSEGPFTSEPTNLFALSPGLERLVRAGVTNSGGHPVVLGAAVGVGLVVGAASLALDLLNADAAHESQTVLRAFDDARVSEALVDKLLEAGRSYRILPPIVEQPDAATPTVDTFVGLETLRVLLVSDDTRIWSPKLQLRVAVGGTLVRASDWHELAYWSWEHRGPTAGLAEWSRDDARLFRAELDRALGALAVRAITDVGPDPVQTSAAEETPGGGR